MTARTQESENHDHDTSTAGDWLAIEPLPARFGQRRCIVCAVNKATLWVSNEELGPCFLCDACADSAAGESISEFGKPPPPELQAATLALVHQRHGVTFLQLERFLRRRGVPVDGDYAISHPDNPSLVLWVGMSAEMVGLVIELLNAGELVPRPTSALAYLNDGVSPDLPLAWPMPDGRAEEATEAWLPVVLAQPRPPRRRRRLHAASK